MARENIIAWKAEVARDLSRKRRKIATISPEAFAKIYLKKHFYRPSPPMHSELFGLLKDSVTQRGARIAIAAPRGHAKSTVACLAHVLWAICYKLEPYILLISNTASQANDHLKHVKDELSENPLLLMDFPEVCEDPANPGTPPRWRQDDIITRSGVRLSAYGAGKQIRGRRQKQQRPTLVILDDVESDEMAESQAQRDKLLNWFTKAILKVGTPDTNFIVLGTLMHYDSLLARLLDSAKSPGWTGHKYQAVISWAARSELWEQWESIYTRDAEFRGATGPETARAFYESNEPAMLEGTEVLWSEKENYYQLMVIRICEGRASFDSEKQNEPTDPANCLFVESDFVYWDKRFADEKSLIASFGRHRRMLGGCDPSLGKQGKNQDYSAIVTVLQDMTNNTFYLLDADIRRRTPDQTIEAILEYQRRRDYCFFGIETNQFQDFMADELIKRGQRANLYVPVRKIVHTSDKRGRIQSLQPKVSNGTIQFSKNHRLLLEQLRLFPNASHDDGPDALEMAIWLAINIRRARMV